VPNCTKNRARDPLGVCSVLDNDRVVITCPVRFRERWIVAEQAASFFFCEDSLWTSLTEVRLRDRHGQSAGNIDVVLVEYDSQTGRVLDFGALEIQAVYISGNVRRPFQFYMDDPQAHQNMDWSTRIHYPRPDYLSSSRKRLAPQLLYKGGILHAWNKKMAVAVDRAFFSTLPELPFVAADEADIAWLVYDLVLDIQDNVYHLVNSDSLYTRFTPALETITRAEPGPVEGFVETLQEKIDEKLEQERPPDAATLLDLLDSGG